MLPISDRWGSWHFHKEMRTWMLILARVPYFSKGMWHFASNCYLWVLYFSWELYSWMLCVFLGNTVYGCSTFPRNVVYGCCTLPWNTVCGECTFLWIQFVSKSSPMLKGPWTLFNIEFLFKIASPTQLLRKTALV